MKYLTQYVPQGSGGMSDGYVVVEENGELKLQKLSFNGTEATPDGATKAIGNVGLFATGMDEPAYAGSGGGEDEPEKEMPTNGLVLHYNMNDVGDTVTDTVNNIVLTSNGTQIVSGATGVNGTCWGTSGGTSSYLTGTYTNTLPSVFSMNLYIQYNGTAADSNVAIVEFGNNSEGTGYGLWVNTSGQLSWRINANYNHYTSTNLTLPAFKFVMITFTYDGANVCIYQNGILHRTESCTDIPSTSSSFGFFSRLAGGDPYGTNGSFIGVVDEFRFYDRVLTQDEITLLASEFTGSGGGGGGSAMKFYQCTAVDTANKTWTGKELILQDGVYVVSDTVTENLIYSGFTPIVGMMYNEDATFTIGQLFTPSETLEGCVFAANMQTTSATYNGETVNLEGITLADAPGYTDGTKALYKTNTTIFSGINGAEDFADGNITVAFSARLGKSSVSTIETFLKVLTASNVEVAKISQVHSGGTLTNNFGWRIGGSYWYGQLDVDISVPTWCHVVLIFDNTSKTGRFLVNGIERASRTNNSTSSVQEVSYINTGLTASDTYIKDLQVYNRVLDENEIADLYSKAKLPATA